MNTLFVVHTVLCLALAPVYSSSSSEEAPSQNPMQTNGTETGLSQNPMQTNSTETGLSQNPMQTNSTDTGLSQNPNSNMTEKAGSSEAEPLGTHTILGGISNPDNVTYGCRVVINHITTDRTLHSHTLLYYHPGSSYQQQVTTMGPYKTLDDTWDVWPGKGLGWPWGTTVKYGDVVRMYHPQTGKMLHSHNYPSPVTAQQEVTGYAGDDFYDDWMVEKTDGLGYGTVWQQNVAFRLIHVITNHSLHSHNRTFDVQPGATPLNMQGEVTAWPYSKRNADDLWTVLSVQC